MYDLAAYLAVLLLLLLAVFQTLLVMGKPLGRYAWGGAHDVLPTKLRIGSFISVILYALFATIVLDAAQITNIFPSANFSEVGLKILTGYFLLGIFMNLASRSKSERALMTPVAAVLFLCCLTIVIT